MATRAVGVGKVGNYWGKLTLCSRRTDMDVFNRVFQQWAGHRFVKFDDPGAVTTAPVTLFP